MTEMRVVDVTDPSDPLLDDLRDLNNSDRRPDLPGGRGLVIAEGTYVVGRMLLSRFRPHVMLGTDSRLAQLRREATSEGWDADERAGDAVYLRASKDLISQVIGFRSSRDILAAADRLGYVHIGESHRGYLGSGTVDFGSFFRALAMVDYDGPIAFESFSTAVVDDILSVSLAVWRNLWDDSDDLGRHANDFIRGNLRAVETIALH